MIVLELLPAETAAQFAAREIDAMLNAANFGISDRWPSNVPLLRDPGSLHQAARMVATPLMQRGSTHEVFTPEETILRGVADCKAFTVLLTAMGRAVGLPPVAWIVTGEDGDCFLHIFPLFEFDGVEIPIDGLARQPGEIEEPKGVMCVGKRMELNHGI